MLDEKLLLEKAKEYYKKQYLLLEKDFMRMVEESKTNVPNSKVAIELFQIGYEKGKEDSFKMKENADGCSGCAFESTESWEMPCRSCSRNNKDYWRGEK